MNFYQISIRTIILLLIFGFCKSNCLAQEASIHALKVSTINDKFDRYAPFFESRSNRLLWTQRNVNEKGDTLDKLFFTENGNSQVNQFNIFNIPYPLSSVGTCNITLDGSGIIFSGALIKNDTTWFIMTGKRNNNQYYYTKTIDSGKLWMGHPCLSLNDSMIVYSAIKKVGSKSDLYFIHKVKNDEWSVPEMLPVVINTSYEELSPFLTLKKNNLLLYFSSDRPNGKGGLDIYYSNYDVNLKSWTKPLLMPFVNTEYDDAFPSVPHDTSAENIIYFASNRNKDNIWELYSASPNPTPPAYIIVEGSVFDISKKNNLLPIKNSNIIFRDFNSSKSLTVQTTDNNGHYIATIPLDLKLYIEAFASGKASKDTLVFYKSDELKGMKSVHLDFYLRDTFSLVTDTVFFDYNKAVLRINSRVELVLERISDYLKMNPINQIRIVGHTDKIGGYEFNMDLSTRRAKAVVDTLINRGFKDKEFQFEGKAYLQPLKGFEDCQNVDACAPNRRVEIFYQYRKE